jgi:hypothetical protein
MPCSLLRVATGAALLALGACAQSPQTVVIDASAFAPPAAIYAAHPGLSETDEAFGAPAPRPDPRPSFVAIPRPILFPNRIYLPVDPPEPIIVRIPSPGGPGDWIPVVQ